MGSLAIVALLLVPSVLAGSSSGLLTASGELRFSARTELDGAPLALFGTDAAALASFELRAPTAKVVVYESRWIAPNLTDSDPSLATGNPTGTQRILDDVVLRLASPAPGWLGLYPGEAAHLALKAERTLLVKPSGAASIPEQATTGGESPDRPWYQKQIEASHLQAQMRGLIETTGGGAWKIGGGTFHVQALEGDFTVRTGKWRESPYEVVERWMYVELPEGIVQLDTGAGVVVAAFPQVDVVWQGDLVADAAEGEIRAPGARYTADGRAALVSGSFVSRAYPVDGGPGGARTVVTLDGEMRSANLPSAPVPAALRGAVPLWPAWVALAVAVAAAAFVAGILVWRARVHRRTGGFTADDCAAFAWRAAEEEDWTAAAAWIERARKLAPASDRLWKDEGFFYEELGQHDEALDRYVHAVGLRPDAFTCVRIARLHVTLGRREDEVEAWLDRACRLDATALDDIAEEPAFSPLLRQPRFARFARRPSRGSGAQGFF